METYISVDIETDGPIPGDFSMLSLGAAAFDADGNLISTFAQNINQLPEASQDPDTMKWWSTQPKAWQALQSNVVNPVTAMKSFHEWQSQYTNPVFIAWPLSFEAMFLGHYLWKFAGAHPFSYRWVDMRSYAAGTLKCNISSASQQNFPKHWSVDDPHTHVAFEDAIEQGRIFMKMVKENKDYFR